MFYKTLAVLIVLCCLATIVTSKRRFKLEFDSFSCINVTELITMSQCEYDKFAANHYLFSTSFMFDRVPKELQLGMKIYIRLRNSNKDLLFVNLRINTCQVFESISGNRLVEPLIKEFRRSSNIPLDCPFQANFSYKMDRLAVTADLFPPYAPDLNFTYNLEMFEAETLIGHYQAKGSLKS